MTVVVDDILGAMFDFDIAGTSLMPLLLSFIAMFGVGGLFATQFLDVHGGQAALIGTVFGLVGMGIAYALFSMLRRDQADEPFSTSDLVGDDAYVAVGDPGRSLRQRPGQEGGADPRVQRHGQRRYRVRDDCPRVGCRRARADRRTTSRSASPAAPPADQASPKMGTDRAADL